MCNHRRLVTARNVTARIKRSSKDKVHMVGGMKVQMDGSMVENKRAPDPRPFRSITFCSEKGCRIVTRFTPATKGVH